MKKFILLTFLTINIVANSYSQCNNSSSFGSANAPTIGTATITTCQYMGEYATVNNVVAGTTYTSTSSLPGAFITIRQGTPGGAVIASGTAPLTWTATVGGTYYIHYNTNSGCGTNTSCATSTLVFVSTGGGGGGGGGSTGCTNACAGNINMPSTGCCASCSGNFYDSGGAGGTYGNSQTLVYTICPSTPGGRVRVNFTSFNVEDGFDFLEIFDGNSTAATSLGTYSGPIAPGLVQATIGNTGGCLTFRFTSDGSVTLAGWTGVITCSQPCQSITAVLNSTNPPADANGIIRICQGGSVTFNGSGTFSGSSAGANYSWSLGNGNATGTSVTRTYASPGAYQANLVVSDASGCSSTNSVQRIVQVSTTPTFNTTVSPNPICLGQSANLNANVTMTNFTPNCTPPVAGTTFLPDGTGISYSTSITANCYNSGQTVTSAADIANVCLNMEHSYLGDLDIVLICPNGQQAVLKPYTGVGGGGGGTYLGCAIDDGSNTPGTGRTYCFTPTATTFLVNGATSACGTPASASINAGNYAPVQSFNNFIGCPLNGAWTIRVTDNLAIDNGYIFSWDINLAANASGPSTFTPTITNQGWVAASGLTSTGATTASVTPSSIGSSCYTYSITDNFGCTYNSPQQCVNVTSGLTPTISGPLTPCIGASTTLTASGGSTYSWSNGSSGNSISVSPSTTTIYNVTATDVNGCSGTSAITVTPRTYTVTTSTVNASCSSNNGSATVTASGAIAPLTYIWSNGRTTQNNTGLAPGSYSVTTTDANGCTNTATVNISQPVSFTTAFTQTNILCNSGNNGNIDLSINGGATPITYTWSNGGTTQDLTGLTSGTYTVTITDGSSCSSITSVTLTQPNQLQALLTPVNILCNASASGAVNTIVSGGVSNFSYLWSNGITTQNPTGLAAGTYSVTVTDNNACTTSSTVTVTQPTALSVSVSSVNVSCSSGSNSTISLVVNGGTPVYSYNWNNGSTTQNLTGLSVGVYIATITDVNGCSISNTTTITQPLPLTITTQGNNVTCFGSSNGTATSTANGGISPYSYIWSNGAGSQNLNAVIAGTYSVTVTDANGCTNTNTITITEPTQINSTLTPTNLLCNSINNGSISSSVSGGTATYSYSWSNGNNSANITGLSAGTYTLTITDLNGCTSTNSTTLTQPTALSSSLTPTNAVCFGSNTGSITHSISGGTGSYSYLWSNGANSQNLSNVTAGIYTVTTTDVNSCTITSSVTITEPTQLTNTLTANNVSCNGFSNGSTSLSVSGGIAGYNYLWSNGQNTQNISNVPAGSYDVTITDVNGCTSTNSITITEPTALGSSETLQNVLCNNGTNGTIILNITGGTSGYNFIWNNSATSQNLTGLTSGAYQVTVTDANGCTISNNYTITQPSVISSTTLNVSNATCLIPGSVDISVSGGVGNYTYLWSNTTTTQNLTGLSGGSFTVTITDQNGCSLVNGPNVVISIGTPVASLTSTSNISCNGRNDGSIDITVSGGSPNYTYNWSNGATSEDLLNITAGTYSITVLDNLGCIANVSSIVISEPSALSITDNFSDVTCNGYNNGTVSLNVLGGVPTYNYIWTNGSTTQNLSGLGIGIYAATITDANGCLLTRGPFNITEPTAVSIFNIQAINPTCGSNNGSIDIAVGGGIPNYIYQWSNGQTNQNITTVPGGNYTVTVTDSDGCFAISNLIVLNNSADIILDIVNINESCNQPGSGAVNLVLNGGTPPYNFIWNNGSTTENLTNVASGSYSVTVTDALGCDDIDSVVVTSPLQPTVDAVFLPSLTTDTIISFGEIVNVSAGTNQIGVNYLWTSNGPGNMNFGSNNSNLTDINPEFDGDYLIILTATSTDGCISIDSLNIQVLPNNPEIPTAFSPNGDGNNDIFQVVNLDKTLVQEFKIYNRWGQLIYDDKIQAAWDGKYKGVPQPRDVYMFVISWKTTSGEVDVVKRGNVTLMR